MTYRKPLATGYPTVCQTCFAVVSSNDQDAHDRAVHSDKITISDAAGNVVAVYPDDWRDPIVADKSKCYHPTD